jgi:PKD repeat protein
MFAVLLVLFLSVNAVYAFSVSISPTSAYITLDESVTFTSTISGGVEPYTYRWYLNGTITSWNTSEAIFTPSLDGYYLIYMEVTDNSHVTVRSNNATVTVYPPIPEANFTYTPTYPLKSQTVTFNGSNSTPGAHIANIVSYEWSFGDGTSANGIIVTHSYTASGVYNVTLNVTNCFGYWDIESKLVIVIQPHGPTAIFTPIPEIQHAHIPIMFDASSSLPGWNGTHEMPITEYYWDFGDGTNATTTTPIAYHTYSSYGTYYVTLTVRAPGATPETDSTIRKVIVLLYQPVGGYAIQTEGCGKTEPIAPYLALVAVLAMSFTATKHKLQKRTKHSQNH